MWEAGHAMVMTPKPGTEHRFPRLTQNRAGMRRHAETLAYVCAHTPMLAYAHTTHRHTCTHKPQLLPGFSFKVVKIK